MKPGLRRRHVRVDYEGPLLGVHHPGFVKSLFGAIIGSLSVLKTHLLTLSFHFVMYLGILPSVMCLCSLSQTTGIFVLSFSLVCIEKPGLTIDDMAETALCIMSASGTSLFVEMMPPDLLCVLQEGLKGRGNSRSDVKLLWARARAQLVHDVGGHDGVVTVRLQLRPQVLDLEH